jgi:hypothetical protein
MRVLGIDEVDYLDFYSYLIKSRENLSDKEFQKYFFRMLNKTYKKDIECAILINNNNKIIGFMVYSLSVEDGELLFIVDFVFIEKDYRRKLNSIYFYNYIYELINKNFNDYFIITVYAECISYGGDSFMFNFVNFLMVGFKDVKVLDNVEYFS